MELRGLREVEERTRRRDPDGADPANAVVLDTILALRQTVRERGTLPFDFAALRVLDDLRAVSQTLQRCLGKRGTRAWPDCTRLSGGPSSAAGSAPATCAWPTTPSSSWPGTWSLRPIPRRGTRPLGLWSAPGSRRAWTN